jgi:predicted dehydrogenase
VKKLRGICLGAGYFSRFQYEAWTRIPEVEILAVCNRSPEKAQEVAETYGIPRAAAWDELETLLDELRPDFIDIITPPETHLDVVKMAAVRGIHVICQKPLAPTLEESQKIVSVAREAGIRFLVHENWRWQPWYREIKTQLDGDTLGELFSISVRMRMGDGWQPDAYLARQPFFRTYPRLLVYETAVHFLDAFRFLGGEVESIYSQLSKRNPDIAGEDAGIITATFVSGATALLDASRYNESAAVDPRYTFGTVRIDGSKGHIELDVEGGLTFKALGQSPHAIEYKHERQGFAGDCVYGLQRRFTDCMLNDLPFESTGEDYLKTIALVEACYESNAAGRVVKLQS